MGGENGNDFLIWGRVGRDVSRAARPFLKKARTTTMRTAALVLLLALSAASAQYGTEGPRAEAVAPAAAGYAQPQMVMMAAPAPYAQPASAELPIGGGDDDIPVENWGIWVAVAVWILWLVGCCCLCSLWYCICKAIKGESEFMIVLQELITLLKSMAPIVTPTEKAATHTIVVNPASPAQAQAANAALSPHHGFYSLGSMA